MAQLKLKVKKTGGSNPVTKQKGFVARVLTNGTADFDDIVEDAAEDTTFNQDEIRAAAGIFCRAAAKKLKQGYIVNLGPIGKLYPSCSSGWYEKAEDLKLENVKLGLYYHAGNDVEAAVKAAKLVWAKASDEEEEEEENEGGGNSGENTGGNNGGGGGTLVDDPDGD